MHTDHPFTEKQDVFQLPDFAAGPYSVICDFDGTVTPFDVTDAILERFARPAWKTIEDEWVPSRPASAWSGRSRSSRLRWSGWTPFWTRSPSPAGSWSSCGTAARKASPSAS